mgnify:CR=1 FL=1
MSNIPADLKYVASHEWLRQEEDGTITVGITHHAQDLLGDIVYVELPEVVDAPETINEDPYGEGWFFKIKPDNADDYQGLMDADEYQDSI